MIYKYCCTSCGNQFSGEKISFDLVELLDLDFSVDFKQSMEVSPAVEHNITDLSFNKGQQKDSTNNYLDTGSITMPSFVQSMVPASYDAALVSAKQQYSEETEKANQGLSKNVTISENIKIKPREENKPVFKAIHAFISSEELKNLAKNPLVDKKSAMITISMQQFLSYMTVGVGRGGIFSKLPVDDTLAINALKNSLTVGENKANVESIAKGYWEAIREKFRLKPEAEQRIMELEKNSPEDKEASRSANGIKKNPDNYEASFEIIPQFFPKDSYGSDKHINTLKYIKEGVETEIRRKRGVFRGYCTNQYCRKPILKYTGLYPHRVVGMLGAMSAGKTSMITAMTVEIEKEFSRLGIAALTGEDKLYDDDAEFREMDYQLYKHGWAVGKTVAATREGSYNVSFLLTDRTNLDEKVILTLADIAGEKCYDPVTRGFDMNAFTTFPLIGHCDVYLVCSCIDQEGYGNAEGVSVRMPSDAVTSIAAGIYNKYYERNDERIPPLCIVMTKADMANENTVVGSEDNPFSGIKPKKEYMFKNLLEILSSTYSTTPLTNIRESLKFCADTYNEMSKWTYLAILSAAAMGREADKYLGDPITIGYNMDYSPKGEFRRTRVFELWSWLLKVCGVVPIVRYKFPEVPSYLEYYSTDYGSHVYHINNCLNRLKSMKYVVINQSNADREIYRQSIERIAWAEAVINGGEKNARKKRIMSVMPNTLEESRNTNRCNNE